MKKQNPAAKRKKKVLRSAPLEGQVGYPSPTNDFWFQLISAFQTHAGQVVSPKTAQNIATVYACTQAIAESVAMIPREVRQRIDRRTTKPRPDHWLNPLISREPNPRMDDFEFFEMGQCCLLDYGNSYSHIKRWKSTRVEALTPFPAAQVTVGVDQPTGRLVYKRYNPESGQNETYDQRDILHIRHRTRDGIRGLSPVEEAAGVFGFGLALQDHINKVFENGAFLSGFIKSAFAFKDDEARTRFMDSFKKYAGTHNAGKFGLLEQGVDYQPFQQNNQQAELSTLSHFSTIELAKLYRMPPQMIQEMAEGMSYASVEQIAIFFRSYTIAPWVTRWQKATERQLFDPETEGDLFIHFDLDALERGDLASRTNAIVAQLQNGLKTINEGRYALDDNPIDHEMGDEILVSHNLIPIDKVGEISTTGGLAAANPPLPADDAAPDAASDETAPDDPPAPATKSRVSEQFAPIIDDVFCRMLENERKALRRALRSGGFLAAAERFYDGHRSVVRDSLKTPCRAFAGLTGCADPGVRVSEFVDGFLGTRQKALLRHANAKALDVDAIGRELDDSPTVEAKFWTAGLMRLLEETENAEQIAA